MLMPKRVKYRNVFRGNMRGTTRGGATAAVGEYGLKSVEASWIPRLPI